MNKLYLLIFVFYVSGCVSVKIGDATSKKSTRYSYTAPNKDFYRIKDGAVDLAWISQGTSSTLSVKSKCLKSNEVNLDDWFAELTGSFPAAQVLSAKKYRYNNRKALRGEIETSLEGFDNRLAVTSFIKNSCQYILVLTSSPTNYQKDLPIYEEFLESFKAW